MKKLPTGIQTFSKIREDNYAYVDKTEDELVYLNKLVIKINKKTLSVLMDDRKQWNVHPGFLRLGSS